MSLHDLLKRDVQKIISGIGRNEKGNIFPLIIEEVERCIIGITLQETKCNLLLTSRLLGIGRSTLYRKIRKLKIHLSD